MRYRNLLSVMYFFIIIEVIFRTIAGSIHPLTEDYFLRTPPGRIMNLPLLVLVLITFVLSLRVPRTGRPVA